MWLQQCREQACNRIKKLDDHNLKSGFRGLRTAILMKNYQIKHNCMKSLIVKHFALIWLMATAGCSSQPNILSFWAERNVDRVHAWHVNQDDTDRATNVDDKCIVSNYSTIICKDYDEDGVIALYDRCPGTKKGVQVTPTGCALDQDADGISDHEDHCANTDIRYKIDERGCALFVSETDQVKLVVHFDSGSAALDAEQLANLEAIALYLNQHPGVPVTIEGHTDSHGRVAYNQLLSKRRAETVRQLLVSEYQLPIERIVIVGYGEKKTIGI